MKLKYNDEYHSYWLDGKRCKGVTTVAKIPDDTYRLELWAKRQVAIGLASSPALIESVAAHFDDDKKVNSVCDEAMEQAKASSGATRGTAAHRITERHDLGEPIMDTPLAAYVVASWQAALEATGLEVVPEYIERIVVYPELRIAGRFDRLCRRTSDGRLVVADVKGGERALRYPHSMTIQCGLYANATLLAGPVPSGGGETEQFEPMPDVDKEIAYIFHLPESGEASVAAIDIARGWDITQRAVFPILKWRDLNDLCQPVATIVAGGEQVPDSMPVEPAPPGDVDRRNALIARVKDLTDEQRQEMARRWPEGVPTFKASPSHSDADLDAIELVLGGIDLGGAVGPIELPPEPPPSPPTVEWAEPDSERLTDDAYEAVKAMFEQQPADVVSLVTQWAMEAHAAGRAFTPRDKRTERRAAILTAAVGCAAEIADLDVVRAVIGWVAGFDMQETFTTGAALGSLTYDQALRVWAFTQHFGRDIALLYDSAGGVAFVGDGLAAVAA